MGPSAIVGFCMNQKRGAAMKLANALTSCEGISHQLLLDGSENRPRRVLASMTNTIAFKT